MQRVLSLIKRTLVFEKLLFQAKATDCPVAWNFRYLMNYVTAVELMIPMLFLIYSHHISNTLSRGSEDLMKLKNLGLKTPRTLLTVSP